MKREMPRREFMVGSLAAAALAGASTSGNAADKSGKQEFYELRVYEIDTPENQEVVGKYLESALLPALERQGLGRVGVFKPTGKKTDHSLYVLIPYPSLAALGELNDKLAADAKYQKAASSYLGLPKAKPAYKRIRSRLMKAFAGMPVIELPVESKSKQPRIFELRIYESHNEKAARLKVEMFNEGEIQLMRDVKMGPVFYGETLISDDVPNLTYMLSASDEAAHKKHWDAFRTSPVWNKMKNIPKYKDTVSKITSVMLAPTSYSGI